MDGSGQTSLGSDGWDPAWSPDGGRIAFAKAPDPAIPYLADLFIINTDGSGITALTHSNANEASLAWSPDGKKIAFTTDQLGNTEIYVMKADGSGQTNLTNHPANDSDPSW
jgi:Tol biopolymer transport system component